MTMPTALGRRQIHQHGPRASGRLQVGRPFNLADTRWASGRHIGRLQAGPGSPPCILQPAPSAGAGIPQTGGPLSRANSATSAQAAPWAFCMPPAGSRQAQTGGPLSPADSARLAQASQSGKPHAQATFWPPARPEGRQASRKQVDRANSIWQAPDTPARLAGLRQVAGRTTIYGRHQVGFRQTYRQAPGRPNQTPCRPRWQAQAGRKQVDRLVGPTAPGTTAGPLAADGRTA